MGYNPNTNAVASKVVTYFMLNYIPRKVIGNMGALRTVEDIDITKTVFNEVMASVKQPSLKLNTAK